MPHNWALSAPPDPVIQRAADILQRIISQRCGQPLKPAESQANASVIRFALDPSLGDETYALRNIAGGLEVAGGGLRGLVYGVGRLLREASYAPGSFTPGVWRGSSSPVMPLRGIYFATHFHNWYHEAPLEEIEAYIQELALWGTNALVVWFDQHHFEGIDDPAAQAFIPRLKAMLRAARAVGMQAGLGIIANEGYANSPVHLRADWTAGHDRYTSEPHGHYHRELCPSKPGTLELLEREFEKKMEAFADVGLDFIWLWPYDQGCCTCGECAPWGANGFLRCTEPLARAFKTRYSQGKVILSTWYFDHFTTGEWEGLDMAFAKRPEWVDYLLADDYGERFPPYPLEVGVPGELPIVAFPEISMYSAAPWGGWGANPLPMHLQKLWQPLEGVLSGGFPYSEGIYEDLNKAICAQYFWDPDQPTMLTVRQYLAYEFGAHVVTPLHQVILTLERNLARSLQRNPDGSFYTNMACSDGAAEAAEILRNLEALLPPERRSSWRWRLLYLRAQIDAELAASGGQHTDVSEAAFTELTEMYYAHKALPGWLAPPTRASAAMPDVAATY
ncbi:MAG: hypothetical protein GXY52_01075 [Chloroflexi bacterium]|nr:hypothetical protein [Chloroflexota bacterium]